MRVPLRPALLGAVCLMALLLPGLARPASAKRPAHLFKVATIAPQGSTWMKLMEEMDARVREETGGEVGFRFYPGGQQGSDLDVLRKIRSNQIQGGGIAGVGLGEIEPALRIMELPFMFRDVEEVAVGHRALDPFFEARLRERGFHLLGWAEVGFVYLFSQQPIRTVADLKSQRVWLWEGDPLAGALLTEIGVSPVPLNITDVLTSLQTGIVNTVYVTPYACLSLQWFTRLQTMTNLRLTHSIGAVVLSAAAFDRLTPGQQAIVTRIADETFARLNEATRRQNAESIAAVSEARIEVIEPTASTREAFDAVGRRVWQSLAGRLYEPALLERLLAALAEARGEQEASR
jgi:TRAP-type C4-dicarboxylate transport system substrate-binding protein